ncbi:MAG: DUF134 domain-containing protein [Calditerrivibrio sp.]|nr:DUF134 domain-containing protein [Calditerrivibrio sp.]
MPRKRKFRRCSMMNGQRLFKPAGVPIKASNIEFLYHDELESMKLCDLEDLSQSEAGERMGISRGTVQRLLYSGRKKLVKALTENMAIIISDREQKEELNESMFSSES